MGGEPLDQVVLAGPMRVSRVERSPGRIVGLLVQVGTAIEQQLRSSTLTSGARVPEALRDVFRTGERVVAEQLLESAGQAEGRGMPEYIDPPSARHNEAGNVPAVVTDRVVERRPDRSALDLNVGAAIN